MALVALRRGGYLARTSVDQGVMPNFRFRTFLRRKNEVALVPESEVASTSNMVGDMVEVVRGTSWFSVMFFYFSKIPAPLAVKSPMAAMCLGLMSRTMGISALAPFMAVLRAFWVTPRAFVEYRTDNEETFHSWYWAFLMSLVSPIYGAIKYFGGSGEAVGCSPRTPHRCESTSRTVDTEASSRHSDATPVSVSGVTHTTSPSLRCAKYLLRTRNPGQPLGEGECEERNTKRYRIHHIDGRKEGRVKRNRFDGTDGIEMCQSHDYTYGEWPQAQDCRRNGRMGRRAEITTNGKQVTLRLHHLGRNRSAKDITVTDDVTSSKERPSSNAPNASELMEKYADGLEATDYHTGDEGVHRASIKTPLARVMNLQKRVLKHEKPAKPR